VLVGQKKAIAIAVRNASGRRRWSQTAGVAAGQHGGKSLRYVMEENHAEATPNVQKMLFFVYVLGSRRNDDCRTYVGWTTDRDRRLRQHNAGVGAKSTRGRKWRETPGQDEERYSFMIARWRQWRLCNTVLLEKFGGQRLQKPFSHKGSTRLHTDQ
jgi:hypothetical protein